MNILHMNIIEIFDFAAFSVSLCFLGYAAICDLKSREVENLLWLIYGPIGLGFTIVRIFFYPRLLVGIVVSILVIVILSFLMFYLGLFGGADAKAFICLAVANPIWPLWIKPVLGWLNPIFPLSILINTYLFTVVIIVYSLMRNCNYYLQKKNRLFKGFEDTPLTSRIVAFLTGYKVNLDTLQESYLYPMEQFNGEKRKFKIFFDAESDRNKMLKEIEAKKTNRLEEVWATPGLPLLVFAVFAFFLTGILGDIFVQLIIWILKVVIPV